MSSDAHKRAPSRDAAVPIPWSKTPATFTGNRCSRSAARRPASVIENVRVLYLSRAGIPRASLLHPQESIDRSNELTARLPRLDVARFCDCRIERLRTELPKARLVDLLRIQQEVVEACLDEDS